MKEEHLDPPSRTSGLALTGVFADGSPHTGPSSAHGGHVVGDVLAGKYRIVGFVGEGGMGLVLRARSLPLDVDVAIKVLHREHGDSQAAARLVREASATASLRHPAIVRILDFGETDAGASFLVMELLDGTSLASWIDGNGRMAATEAIRMLLPIADALVLAHARGIVHRDVKPGNILLVPSDAGTYRPKILDFGIAKLLTTECGRVLTDAGAVLGSLEYMSPEQAEGKAEVGAQTDVWALSVVLYELVTGIRPFRGATLIAILASLLTTQPIPTFVLSAGDQELWEILARGLAKSPADRWPDMRAFGSALASWALERGITTDATGMSLTHWLAPPSQPSDGRAAVASARSPVAADPTGPAPPLRRTKAVRATAVAILLMAPVLLAAGLYTRRGDERASSGAVNAATGAGAPMTETHPSAAPAVSSAVEPVPAQSAAPMASEAVLPPPHRAAPAARRRFSPTGMPLPAASNF
jgi:eukaryotic-like serine/threonine-protein kinase